MSSSRSNSRSQPAGAVRASTRLKQPHEDLAKDIVLYVARDYEPGRAIIRGILDHAPAAGRWVFHLSHPKLEDDGVLERVRPAGVIAQVMDEALERRLMKWGGPVVNVSSVRAEPALPTVRCNDLEVGRMAATHLLDCGFRRFGFVGGVGLENARQRAAGFWELLRARGFSAEECWVELAPIPASVVRQVTDGAVLVRWLRGLEPGTAIFAYNDLLAAEVARVLQEQGREIPRDCALLGMDGDPLVTRLSHPSLPSIRYPGESIGREAAATLDRWLAGVEPPRLTLVPPVVLTVRQSAEVARVERPELEKALRFIRERATHSLGVEEIARAAGVNRRTLEREFRAVLGRTPAQEVRRVCVQRAKQLLTDTDLKLEEVARRAGFGDAVRLSEVFRRECGVAPGEFRRSSRASRED